jgi:transposase
VELVVERAAALDVGKDEVVACIRVPDAAGVGRGRGRRRQEVRTYPTFTSSLETLADWLQAEGVTQVVMEATGQQLEADLVGAGRARVPAAAGQRPPRPGSRPAARPMSVMPPGCASCSECGLLRGSFVPPPQIRQLRDLTRDRKRPLPGPWRRVPADPKDPGGRRQQAGSRSPLTSWASRAGPCWRPWSPANATGRSLPSWPRASFPKKLPQLRQALRGRFGDHHGLLVGLALDHQGAPGRRHRRPGRPHRRGDRPVRGGP